MRTVGVARQQQRGTSAKGGFAGTLGPLLQVQKPLFSLFLPSPVLIVFPSLGPFFSATSSLALEAIWTALHVSLSFLDFESSSGRPVGPGSQAWTSRVHSFTLDSELVSRGKINKTLPRHS